MWINSFTAGGAPAPSASMTSYLRNGLRSSSKRDDAAKPESGPRATHQLRMRYPPALCEKICFCTSKAYQAVKSLVAVASTPSASIASCALHVVDLPLARPHTTDRPGRCQFGTSALSSGLCCRGLWTRPQNSLATPPSWGFRQFRLTNSLVH